MFFKKVKVLYIAKGNLLTSGLYNRGNVENISFRDRDWKWQNFYKIVLLERNVSFYKGEKPTSTFPPPSVLWCKFLLSSPFCKRNMDTFIIGFVEQWSVLCSFIG